ncbi:MAG: carbohydrate ABC transporter permease [Frankiales bacterium]|nr:carbohydrate ABC transporter permease [Frankiales bacterium]
MAAAGGRGANVLRLLVIVVFLAPLALVLAGSLRRVGLPPPQGLELLPAEPGLTAYRALGEITPLGRLLRNSLLVVLVAVPLATLIASWAGFALAQLPSRWRRPLVGGVFALLLVPLPMLWVPRFFLFLELGVLGTLVPLIAPALAATTPFTVLLAYRSFRGVPPELWEAARLEGASALTTWRRVGLPMVTATTTAIAAVAFVFHWGNYLDALLYAQSEATRTLPLGLGELATLDSTDQSVLFAGTAVLAVPAVLALLAVQRPLLGAPR